MARTPSPAGTIILIAFSKPIRRSRCTAWGGTPAIDGTVRMFAGRPEGRRPALSTFGKRTTLRRPAHKPTRHLRGQGLPHAATAQACPLKSGACGFSGTYLGVAHRSMGLVVVLQWRLPVWLAAGTVAAPTWSRQGLLTRALAPGPVPRPPPRLGTGPPSLQARQHNRGAGRPRDTAWCALAGWLLNGLSAGCPWVTQPHDRGAGCRARRGRPTPRRSCRRCSYEFLSIRPAQTPPSAGTSGSGVRTATCLRRRTLPG